MKNPHAVALGKSGGTAGRGKAKARITAKYAAVNRWHGEAVANAAAEIAVEITRELALNPAAVGGLAERFRDIIMRNLSESTPKVTDSNSPATA